MTHEQTLAENARLRKALTEVMSWIDNWSPSFTEDDEWNSETLPMVRAALSPPPEQTTEDGWIEWKGGECPVDGDTLVEVRCLLDGEPWDREGADEAGWFDSLDWWKRAGSEHCKITAYRVVTP